MKDELDKIDKKVDKLDDRLDKIDVHLAEYNSHLEIHIKRTNLLEEEVKPIVKHVYMVNGALKLLASSGILLTIYKVLEALRG